MRPILGQLALSIPPHGAVPEIGGVCPSSMSLIVWYTKLRTLSLSSPSIYPIMMKNYFIFSVRMKTRIVFYLMKIKRRKKFEKRLIDVLVRFLHSLFL